MKGIRLFSALLGLNFCLMTAPAMAAKCGNDSKGFNTWLATFKKEMIAKGYSRKTVNSTLKGVTYNKKVVRLDRGQKNFKQSFEKFYKRRTNGIHRIARKKMKQHAKTLAAIEKKYGVDKEMLVAIWGLETAFGRFQGDKPIFQSLATLAYDCRRTEFFTNELVNALTIVERGHLKPSQMIGAWAGEIGQTQFLPSRFVSSAVSFDGDRRIDLYGSVPDVLASTANWFSQGGWKKGQSWDEGSHNYRVMMPWNRATVYQRTIARLANELR